MAIDQRKYEHKQESVLRDIRPLSTRIADGLASSQYSTVIFLMAAVAVYINDWALTFGDLIVFTGLIYFLWLNTRDRSLPFKLPLGSKYLDKNNGRGNKKGKSEGILYLGNAKKTNEEVWFTNSDIRTHFLYLGTTGAGKTEGLKSLVTNAMAWGSGFVYVDGKADTDLWSSLSSLVRRFGRDDDLLVLNYMTGNADVSAPSNTMNPFSSGSASYLTNMLVSLMPESGGDNAMWKERAVSLVGAMMPILTWKRDNQEIPMSVRTIREYLSLGNVIKLARDEVVPASVREGLNGYLDTLPGFIADAYDDQGKVKPPGPDTPQVNTETASQQHGYLAMQFTRSLQSLGDDYGYIFDTQAADVDMVDVVLNRRILVVLVPALEKSGDEVANLGKIVAASIKGMMGSTLGSTVEGSSATVIENKPTHSSTPFMTVFDEVGYYVAEGMAVMAAQARSLGFSLVFAGQDLPAMKKRVREEANSITANCNIKLFGKLEDPTETKDFFEKTVGSAMVTEVSGFQLQGSSGGIGGYHDTKQAGVQLRPRANYDQLRGFKEGEAVITFGEIVVDCAVFYSNPGFAKAMRVTRFMSLPPPDEALMKHSTSITKLRDLMVNKTWTAMRSDVAVETSPELAALNDGFVRFKTPEINPVDAGIAALVALHGLHNEIPAVSGTAQAGAVSGGGSGGGQAPKAPAVTPQPAVAQSPLAAQRPADIIAKDQAGGGHATAKPSVFGGAPASGGAQAGAAAAVSAVTATAAQGPGQQGAGASAVTQAEATTSMTPAQSQQQAPAQTQGQQPAQQKKPIVDPTGLSKDEAMKRAAEKAKENLFGAYGRGKIPAKRPEPKDVVPTKDVRLPGVNPDSPKTVQSTQTPEVTTGQDDKAAVDVASPPVTENVVTDQSGGDKNVKPAVFGGAPSKPLAEPSSSGSSPDGSSAPKSVDTTSSVSGEQSPVAEKADTSINKPTGSAQENPQQQASAGDDVPKKPAIFGAPKSDDAKKDDDKKES